MQKLWWLPIAAVVLAVFGFSPFEAVDIADLAPVQTIVVHAADGRVKVDCGDKLSGQGRDLAEALEDLGAGAEGTVYFATAQQIVVSGDRAVWEQLLQVEGLRPAARLYQSETAPKAADVTAYLLRDRNAATLLELRISRQYGSTLEVPELVQVEGGYRIVSGKPI